MVKKEGEKKGAGRKKMTGERHLLTIRCNEEQFRYIKKHTSPIDRAFLLLGCIGLGISDKNEREIA